MPALPMQTRRLRLACTLASLVACVVTHGAGRGRSEPPAPDPDRIVNESYGFLKDREPVMTEVEYAMYEKIVPMVRSRPEFALTLLESMVADENTSAAFEFVLGSAYYEQRRHAEAEARFKSAIARFPTFARAWDNLGALYFATERYAEAVPCFARVLALGENEPRVLGMLGFCQMRSGNPLAAEASYLQAYSRDPDNTDWIEGLLAIYLDSEQHARAEALLRRLVALRPGESRFWLLLAGTLSDQKRTLDAVAALDAAASLGALETDGALMQGDLCSLLAMHTEAIRAYERASRAAPALGVPRLLNLASAHAAERRFDEAAAALASARSVAGDAERPLVKQAEAGLLIAREAWAEAVGLLDEIVAVDPGNGRALLDLGSAEEAQGHDSRAVIHYETAARFPEYAFLASVRLANLRVRLHDYDAALAAVDRAIALKPNTDLAAFRARVEALASRPRS